MDGPRSPPPLHQASAFQLPAGHWRSVLDCLIECFPHVPRATWQSRVEGGLLQDEAGVALTATTPFRVGLTVRYWRAVAAEAAVPFAEEVLYTDEHLLVADKPPFLPVAPTGGWVEETLLRRLQQRLGIATLAPLHRLDRPTAGLVLFSVNPATRAAYHALFHDRRIDKRYMALAAPLPALRFPYHRRSRLARGEPFFTMREVEGVANSETRIGVTARGAEVWQYSLCPVSGRKHQLRVHMAALGAPIFGDRLYPLPAPAGADDLARPLALLAAELAFTDPLSGEARRYVSRRRLPHWCGSPLAGPADCAALAPRRA